MWEDVTPTGSYPADSEPSFFWSTEDSIIVTLNRLWQTKYPFTFLSSDQGAHWKNIVPALNQTNVLAATYRYEERTHDTSTITLQRSFLQEHHGLKLDIYIHFYVII